MMRRALAVAVLVAPLQGCSSRGPAGGLASASPARCAERTASGAGFHLRRRQPGLLVLETGSSNPVEALYVTIARDSSGREIVAMVAPATYDRIYAPYGSAAAPRDSRLAVRGSYLERRDTVSARTREAAALVRRTCTSPERRQ